MTMLRLLGCGVALAAVSFGLNPARSISQYHKMQWQVEDGLPRNYIMALLPGPAGYLLVFTDEGAARFDGARFSSFGVTDLKLNERWVLSAIRGADGSLSIGTFDGWIYRIAAGKVAERFNAGASVFALLDDGSGT